MSDKKLKKRCQWQKLHGLLKNHEGMLTVNANQVGSNQLQSIRKKLREINCTLLMGKNTLIRRGIQQIMDEPKDDDVAEEYTEIFGDWEDKPEQEKIIELCRGNVGFIFCDGNFLEIKQVIDATRLPAPARAGVIAPSTVRCYSGPTGLDPTQTQFFQTLQVPTKIVKGQIDIINDFDIIVKNEKVTHSQVQLCTKLNLKPFTQGLKMVDVQEKGTVYNAKALEISDNEIVDRVKAGLLKLASVGLEIEYPCKCTLPHMIVNSFKNLAGVGYEIDQEFKQGAILLNNLKNTTTCISTTTVKKEEVVEDDKSDDDVGGMDLFGGGDDDW